MGTQVTLQVSILHFEVYWSSSAGWCCSTALEHYKHSGTGFPCIVEVLYGQICLNEEDLVDKWKNKNCDALVQNYGLAACQILVTQGIPTFKYS